MARLQRRFTSREELARTFLRRLSLREMEVDLPSDSALPVGSPIDLNLRLADGDPLIVGLGEVGGGGEEEGTRRVRFVELSEESRAELPGLVALRDAPARPVVDRPDPDETLQALVAGVFGERSKAPTSPDDTILVPPEPSTARPEPHPPEPPAAPPPAPSPAAAALSEPAAPSRAPAAQRPPAAERPAAPPTPATPPPPTGGVAVARSERPSFLRRLQVSPAVIVASIIAGATGAAANAWFGDLVNVLADADSRATAELVAPPVVDVVPPDIQPSRFPEQEATAADSPVETTDGAESGAAAPIPTPATVPAAASAAALPPAPEEAPVTETASAAPESRPADRVRLITWDEQATGTVVTFWGNGDFLPDRIARFRVGGERPREVVKLRGIDAPFPQTMLDLGTPEVTRVRTGFHPQGAVNELHVVLDLTAPDVVIEQVETAPEKLLLHLSRKSGSPTAGQ